MNGRKILNRKKSKITKRMGERKTGYELGGQGSACAC